jgi:gas vesicle structural protein
MTMTEAPIRRGGGSAVLRSTPGSSGLYDVLELILDKGLVIDAYVRVSLVGIELLTIDARVVVASVDTYLRFAEAVNRLDIRGQSNEETTNLEDITSGIGGGVKAMGAKKAAGGVIDKVGSTVKELTGGDGDDDQGDAGDDEREPARARSGNGNGSSKRRSSSSSSSTRRRRSRED